MEGISLRNKLVVAVIAAFAATVIAIGFAVLPTQAYADYAVGTPANQVVAKYKKSKCKIKGTWKLTKASGYNAATTNNYIKALKRVGKKHTLTFKKNGKAVEKARYGINGRNVSKTNYKWMAASKKKGYLISTSGTLSGKVIGKITVKGKKLTLLAKSSTSATQLKWTFKKN